MGFVQIIEFDSDKIDEMRALDGEWAADATKQGATARRGVLCADRDRPGHYFQVVFFDSYESAMENNALPVTQKFGERMMALGKGEPKFINLDVLEDKDY
jgi:hypothetical protein